MPLITTKVSTSVSKEKEVSLKSAFGKAVELINKSENWLMVEVQDNCRLYFKGSDEPCAMVEVDLFGKATEKGYDDLTAEITRIVADELSVDKSRIYVKYSEIDHWGYSGFNF